MFRLRRSIKLALALVVGSGVLARLVTMVSALAEGDPDQLLAFPLTVIFPAILAGLLLALPATRSREGALMRLGTIIQLALIILLPPVALYLALGLPVVFLVVELFETRLPQPLRAPIVRAVLA
ncbi:MAG: hypothetical protein ACOVNS_02215 [Erythrobacter sp.]